MTKTEIILREIEKRGELHITEFQCAMELYDDFHDFKLSLRRHASGQRKYLNNRNQNYSLTLKGKKWLADRDAGMKLYSTKGNKKQINKTEQHKTRPMRSCEVESKMITGWQLL